MCYEIAEKSFQPLLPLITDEAMLHFPQQTCSAVLSVVYFCASEGEVLAPSACRDLAQELQPHGTGEAGCGLETFNVRIGVTFKRSAARYWSKTSFF